MLLYLIKCLKPNIANPDREITKVMGRPTEQQMKSLFRLVTYVVNTEYIGLIMSPTPIINFAWKLVAYCDSDYAGDHNRRCFRIIDLDPKLLCQSSSEAKYIAISEICAEIVFLKQVLEFLGIYLNLPNIVIVGNVRAIYDANNAVFGPKMNHVECTMPLICFNKIVY